jgi:hypothetical protein
VKETPSLLWLETFRNHRFSVKKRHKIDLLRASPKEAEQIDAMSMSLQLSVGIFGIFRSQVAIYFSTFSAPLRRTEVDQGNCVTADGEMAGDPINGPNGGPNGDGVRHPWISGISYLFGANRNADYC